tara:strand:- start:864 stop:1076 length:213 start_codon:yes stop_codon:yes gene_type:complete
MNKEQILKYWRIINKVVEANEKAWKELEGLGLNLSSLAPTSCTERVASHLIIEAAVQKAHAERISEMDKK